jgi:hypothetical protein
LIATYDLKLNPNDLHIAVRLMTPSPIQVFIEDLTQDGEVSVADAVIGLQHIVGLIPSLEECGPL